MSSTSKEKKKKVLETVRVNLGCSCTRPKLSSIFSPKAKARPPRYQERQQNYYYNYNYQSSPSNTYANTTTTTTNTSSSSPFMASGGDDRAVAVEKDSADPYLDFRASMLQMIVENEMYSKDDLRHLLTCFLQLNSPCLHGVIIRAFTEIWNTFFFPAVAADAGAASASNKKSLHGRPPRKAFHI